MIKLIRDTVYQARIYFILEEPKHWVRTFLKNKKHLPMGFSESWECDAFTLDAPSDNFTFIVITENKQKVLNTIAHECYHASTGILRRAGLRLTTASEEAFAYHYEWLFDKLVGAYEKSKKEDH